MTPKTIPNHSIPYLDWQNPLEPGPKPRRRVMQCMMDDQGFDPPKDE